MCEPTKSFHDHEVFDTAQAGGADPYDSESTVRSWGSGVTGL